MKRPLLSISPHGGEAVSSVAFLSAPQHPDHHVLLTAVQLHFLFSGVKVRVSQCVGPHILWFEARMCWLREQLLSYI